MRWGFPAVFLGRKAGSRRTAIRQNRQIRRSRTENEKFCVCSPPFIGGLLQSGRECGNMLPKLETPFRLHTGAD